MSNYRTFQHDYKLSVIDSREHRWSVVPFLYFQMLCSSLPADPVTPLAGLELLLVALVDWIIQSCVGL